MSEDTRVYASMLVCHNIVPEQVLFEAGCPDYQDDRSFPVLAQAAENLMRVGCDSTDDDADSVSFSLSLCLAMPSFLGAYRTSYLEGYLFGGLLFRLCFFSLRLCLEG